MKEPPGTWSASRLAVTASMFVSVSLTSWAEEVSLLLVDGDLASGELVAVDGSEVRLRSAGTERSIPLEGIDPVHVYSLFESRSGDSAAERLRLADYCLAHGLSAFAEREYLRAAALDPSCEGLAREGIEGALEQVAEALYREAEELALRGVRTEERAVLERIVEAHPGTRTALLARAELALLDRAGERRAERERRAEERRLAEVRRRAEILDRYLNVKATEAAETRADAASSIKFARGHRLLLDAAEAFEGLIPYANELAKYDAGRAGEWRQRIKDELIGIYIMLTVVELERHNSRQANHWIALTLLLDPENERAKELRDINVTYGMEEDPYRMTIGELSRRLYRHTASAEMIRAFANRTGRNGLLFLEGLNPPRR